MIDHHDMRINFGEIEESEMIERWNVKVLIGHHESQIKFGEIETKTWAMRVLFGHHISRNNGCEIEEDEIEMLSDYALIKSNGIQDLPHEYILPICVDRGLHGSNVLQFSNAVVSLCLSNGSNTRRIGQ